MFRDVRVYTRTSVSNTAVVQSHVFVFTCLQRYDRLPKVSAAAVCVVLELSGHLCLALSRSLSSKMTMMVSTSPFLSTPNPSPIAPHHYHIMYRKTQIHCCCCRARPYSCDLRTICRTRCRCTTSTCKGVHSATAAAAVNISSCTHCCIIRTNHTYEVYHALKLMCTRTCV